MDNNVNSTSFLLTAIIDGEDAVNLDISPSSIVWNQEGDVSVDAQGNTVDNSSWPKKYITASVRRGDADESGWLYGYTVGSGCSFDVRKGTLGTDGKFTVDTNGHTFELSNPRKTTDANGKQAESLWTNGTLRITATKDGSKKTKDADIILNALATWKQSVVNGTMTAVSQKTETQVDGKMKTYESRLTQAEVEISAKVSKSDAQGMISSAISQSADEIKLGISSRKEYRNIIKGSDFSYIADNVQLNADTGQTVEVSDTERYDTSRSVHIKVTKEGSYNGVFIRPVIVKTSTKHYVSVLSKGTGTLVVEMIDLDSDGARKEHLQATPFTLSGEWTLCRVPFTTGGYDRIEVNFWMYVVGEAYISRPMLEEGSEYTGWTLSPDDPTTEDRLRDTGIDIRKGTIDLRAGNVNFLGADGKPYITAELDADGMPHLIFYNKAGTKMYDLGYTGLFNLIQDSDKQTWVEYSGQVIDGDTSNCSDLTGGNYRLTDGDFAEALILDRTIYEYHPAYVMSNGEKTYYNNDCKNQLYYSDTVDESNNNKPTGTALYTDNGILRLNGYLYELVERKVVSKKTNGGTTTIEEHFRFRAHAIYRNRLNLSGGMTDYTEGRTVKIEKFGTAIAGSVETKYKVSIDGSDYEDKDIVKLS